MNGRDGFHPTAVPRWGRISRAFELPFLWLSVVGLAASLTAHLLGWFGVALPPPVLRGLHAGSLVVWFPMVVILIRLSAGMPRRDGWMVVLHGCPLWMRNLVMGIGIYSGVNFVILLILSATGILISGATIARTFSGHCLFMYSVAMIILYSYRHVQEADDKRRCLNGHQVVSVSVKFCEQCGAPVAEPNGSHSLFSADGPGN